MIQKKFSCGDSEMVYYTVGTGPYVVLLHGFPLDHRLWSAQAAALRGFTVIMPDLPGSGLSATINDMSIEGMAGCIKGLMENEWLLGNGYEGDKFTLIGHSLGGYITLAFAEKYPSLLKGFGLFHSTAYADTDDKKNNRRKAIQEVQKNGTKDFIKTSVSNLYSGETKENNPALIDHQIEGSRNFPADSVVMYNEAMMARPDRTKVLREAAVPVLFVMGKFDKVITLEDSLRQCYLPDLSYIHNLEHSGHLGMQEEPENSTRYLQNFLNSIHDTQ